MLAAKRAADSPPGQTDSVPNAQRLAQTVHQAIIHSFSAKEEHGRSDKKEDFDITRHTLKVIPPDFIGQLQEKKFTIQSADDDYAVISTQVHHEQLDKTFNLKLGLRFDGSKWIAEAIPGFTALLESFYTSLDLMKQEAFEKFSARNAEISEKMHTHYAIDTCTMAIFPPTETYHTRLRITVAGKNAGSEILINSGVLISINDKDKKTVAKLYLENSVQVMPSDEFKYSWFIMNDENNAKPEIEMLADMQDLTCAAEVASAVLDSSRLLREKKWQPQYKIEP
jgi:hypothetical protein